MYYYNWITDFNRFVQLYLTIWVIIRDSNALCTNICVIILIYMYNYTSNFIYLLFRYKSTYSYNYNNNQYSYMSIYVTSILYLQREPIKS